MKPERWKRIDEIFQAALDHELEQRPAFLDEACAGDAPLRKEVELLLVSDAQADGFLRSPAVEHAAPLLDDDKSNSMLGRQFGSYQIIAHLGAGGMGEVYLAEDSRLGRKVALKLLPLLFTKDEQRLRRFQQEARAASALNHPNIITIFDIGQVASTDFIATEYIEGETLRAAMHRGMKLNQALDVAIQTANALQAAHQAGIVHRDIKPENIMLRADGYVKVLDFGLAKLAERHALTSGTQAAPIARVETDPGTVMGTASYMSPEQSRGLDVDSRTDIFSLGVVFYEMVAGRVPFEGETTSDVIAAILEKEPAPLARYEPNVPAAIQWIVTKALRKDKDERYQTITEMLSDLREIKQDLEARARAERGASPEMGGKAPLQTSSVEGAVETASGLAVQTAETGARTTSSAEIILSEIKRHKRVAMLALVLFAVVVGAIVFGLYKSFEPRKRSFLFQIDKVTRLTMSGKIATVAALSPDGKLFAYSSHEGEKESLWIGHVGGGPPVEIHSHADGSYVSLTFAPDGNSLYYTFSGNGSLYKLPVFGGAPEKIRNNVVNRITFAPDGKRFAFVRNQQIDRKMALVVADTEGAGEREIAEPPDKRVFASHSPSWSPDGATIALGASVNDNDSSYEVFTVGVADGAMGPLTVHGWNRIESVSWRHDGNGLIAVARDKDSVLPQLWSVSYPQGEVQRIVTDLNVYNYSPSLSADDRSLLIIQAQDQSNIWVAPAGDLSRAKQVTFGAAGRQNGFSGLDWTHDGRIVYTARANEDGLIWIMNADGIEQRQLIPAGGYSNHPSVTDDDRYLVFQSNRSGKYAAWRVNLDGSDMRELTDADIAGQPDVSPDGRWIVYVSSREGFGTLYRISIDGAEPQRLTDKRASWVRISPDSKFIACGYLDDEKIELAILPIEGGEPLKLFDVPKSANFRLGIRWTADGKGVTYRDWANGIWKQDLEGGEPERLAGLPQEKLYGYGWSRDGKLFAFTRGVEARDVILINNAGVHGGTADR